MERTVSFGTRAQTCLITTTVGVRLINAVHVKVAVSCGVGGVGAGLDEEHERIPSVDSDGHHQRRPPRRVALLEAALVDVEEREDRTVVRADGAVEGVVPVDVGCRERLGEGVDAAADEREVADGRGVVEGELPEVVRDVDGHVRRRLTALSWRCLIATMSGVSPISFSRSVLAFMSSSHVIDASQS